MTAMTAGPPADPSPPGPLPGALPPGGPPPNAPGARPPKGRGAEFPLLACAVLVAVSGYAAVGLARNGAVPRDMTGYATGLGVLSLLAHLAVRVRAAYADPLLLPIAVLLNGLGL